MDLIATEAFPVFLISPFFIPLSVRHFQVSDFGEGATLVYVCQTVKGFVIGRPLKNCQEYNRDERTLGPCWRDVERLGVIKETKGD